MNNISLNKLSKNNQGTMLMVVIVLTGLFMALALGAIGLALLQQKMNTIKIAGNQAIHIAEAGVNYYRWVLYHDHEEYCNKESCHADPDNEPYGPYEYKDASGNITGYYNLYITPPLANGSTIVKIKSIGWEAGHPNITKTIEVHIGIPSWSSYSALADDFMRFGEGTNVWGEIHSNKGIRFDGVAHNLITSAVLTTDDPDHTGAVEFGVHNHLPTIDPFPDGNNPPLNVPAKPSIFVAGRSFPAQVVSFNLLDNYTSETYIKATTSGLVFDPRASGTADPYSVLAWRGCISGTCDEGFHITLKNNNTFDIRGVSAVMSPCGSETTNSIQTEGSATNYPIPSNGVIFVKNNVWVDGNINNSRVSILAFKEPFTSGTADIYLNNDLTYTAYDSSDSIGLIAQRNISVGRYSEDDLQIDAALIAKTGRVGRNYYSDTCSDWQKTTITINGSIATAVRYGFAYTDGTGYINRNLNYDNNLTFSPPPHYPTTGEYTFISWKED